MKCQILFSGKNKKNIINLSSAEYVQRVVKIKGSWYTFRGDDFIKIGFAPFRGDNFIKIGFAALLKKDLLLQERIVDWGIKS